MIKELGQANAYLHRKYGLGLELLDMYEEYLDIHAEHCMSPERLILGTLGRREAIDVGNQTSHLHRGITIKFQNFLSIFPNRAENVGLALIYGNTFCEPNFKEIISEIRSKNCKLGTRCSDAKVTRVSNETLLEYFNLDHETLIAINNYKAPRLEQWQILDNEKKAFLKH